MNWIFQKIEGLYKHFRRHFYLTYRYDYVLESLKKRKGECKMCGCCRIALFGCKHFDRENNRCLLWEKESKQALPTVCQIYPFDEKDKLSAVRDGCGFYWEK